MKTPFALFVVAALLFSLAPAKSELWLPSIFGDHMVLQAGQPVTIWGRAAPGETVTVEILGANGAVLARESAQAGADRRWNIKLPPLDPGQNVSLKVFTGSGSQRDFKDVLTGEVWLLSGQSNMRWALEKSLNGDKEVAAALHPELRLFLTDVNPQSHPKDDLPGSWAVCSPESAANFSGPGYFFGRDLMRTLDRPVGLICSAVGGTPIHPWIALAELDANPLTKHLEEDRLAYFAQPPEKRKRARGTWIYGAKGQFAPGWLYNGMIHPLIPLAIKGVAWCQGESNSRPSQWGGPDLYHTTFPMLIESWRRAWGQEDMPFLYVELASFMAPQTTPVDAEAEFNWAWIREAQASALALSKVFMIPAIDLGEADEIHYANKQEVGRRLSLTALAEVYQLADRPGTSPRYRAHEIEGDKMRIFFDDAAGLKTRDGENPRTFAIRGSNTDWLWAEATIEGDSILVWHPEIKNPLAVRHAWAGNPAPNVVNQANLPLSSFRTDRDNPKTPQP